MSKITSEILKIYSSFDQVENGDCTVLSLVKWNGREPKGYDIRKYKKEENKVYKGITISYDAFETMIVDAIKNGLVDVDKIKKALDDYDDKLFTQDDFKKMFNNVSLESSKFQRNKYGALINKHGQLVLSNELK